MATSDNFLAQAAWQQQAYMNSTGTQQWNQTDPYGYTYYQLTAVSAQLSYIPPEVADLVEPIQGDPKGAKYLISYAFKKSKDPVVFLKSEKDMRETLERLTHDTKVDQKTILVHEISKQFKPIKKIVKKESVELEEAK